MLHYTIRCWYNLFLMEMFPSTVISTSMIYRLGNSWTTQSAYDLIRLILEFENKLIYNHSASPTGHDRFNACFSNPLVTLLLPPPHYPFSKHSIPSLMVLPLPLRPLLFPTTGHWNIAKQLSYLLITCLFGLFTVFVFCLVVYSFRLALPFIPSIKPLVQENA